MSTYKLTSRNQKRKSLGPRNYFPAIKTISAFTNDSACWVRRRFSPTPSTRRPARWKESKHRRPASPIARRPTRSWEAGYSPLTSGVSETSPWDSPPMSAGERVFRCGARLRKRIRSLASGAIGWVRLYFSERRRSAEPKLCPSKKHLEISKSANTPTFK